MSDAVRLLKARYRRKVDKRGPDECWIWTGARTKAGYGTLRGIPESSGLQRQVMATHIALMLDGRPKPGKGALALHSCDNPPCVNPKHLRWGTHAENYADMVDRERGQRLVPYYQKRRAAFEKMDNAAATLQLDKRQGKLSADDVSFIRQSGQSAVELATRFGVSRRTIINVLKRVSWTDID
jgi:hypothetical protein